jgi:hypothetical protein
MTEPLKAKITEFVESLLTLDSWDPTPEEAADHILKLVAEHQPAAVDVFGYSGEFLYAGHLQPRQDGGWNVFHHTDSRHECPPQTEPPAVPRVFFPYDTVPAGVAVQSAEGDIARYAVAVQLTEQEGWDGPGVEIQSLTAKEWQAAVDQAGRERREREQAHAALLGAELGADVAREHGVLPDEDEAADHA